MSKKSTWNHYKFMSLGTATLTDCRRFNEESEHPDGTAGKCASNLNIAHVGAIWKMFFLPKHSSRSRLNVISSVVVIFIRICLNLTVECLPARPEKIWKLFSHFFSSLYHSPHMCGKCRMKKFPSECGICSLRREMIRTRVWQKERMPIELIPPSIFLFFHICGRLNANLS